MDNLVENAGKLIAVIALGAAALFIVFGGIFAVYKSASASGEASYCYIRHFSTAGMMQTYDLWAFREWRSDRHIMNSSSPQELIDLATKMNCTLQKKN